MKTKSLRFQLILWYAVGLVLVFALTTFFLYTGVRHYLGTSVSETQIRRAQRIASFLPANETFPLDAISARISGDFAPEATSRFIRVIGRNGTVLYESGAPADGTFNPKSIPVPRPSTVAQRETLQSGVALAIGTVATPAGMLVQSGESLEPALKELDRLLLSLIVGFVIVGAVALAGGSLLVERALQPVERIIGSAENITSRNLSERLPVPTDDEFKHLSESLNRMITRLDEAFQLNRRFLADASHELRTPLTILRSELEATLQRTDLPSDLRETTGTLSEEVERLVLIVETLFALSRFDTGEAKKEYILFDLAKLAASTADQMALLAEDKQITLEAKAETSVMVEGDRPRLKQVIVNLLDNAIKYTGNGGKVTVAVFNRDHEAIIEVADTGLGIPAEAMPHVFDRFFRVDQARSRGAGGAGIGLSIVKAICAAHHGSVDVRSTIDAGSTFTVRLPRAKNHSSFI